MCIRDRARAASERVLGGMFDQLSTFRKDSDIVDDAVFVSPKIADLDREYKTAKEAVYARAEELKERAKRDKGFQGSREWFDAIDENRESYFVARGKQFEYVDALPDGEEKDQLFEGLTKPKQRVFKSSGNFNYHPEIESRRDKFYASSALSAFTGESVEEVNSKVKAKVDEGMSVTEAYRSVWNAAEIRSDKPLVVIDLETAGPRHRVSTGAYSSIIEVGYVVRYPDGREVRKSYLSGLSDAQKSSDGTGAVDVHNITTDMVEGKKRFVDDVERQEELLNDLKGSVLVAHNANFEKQQLTHSLFGFHNAVKSGDIEILDTMNVCKYFVPDAPTNTNESFVTTSGGVYENAHRALDDAEMTLGALRSLKNF